MNDLIVALMIVTPVMVILGIIDHFVSGKEGIR